MSNYAVTATLTAIDNFSSVFQRAGQAVQNFGKSATSHLSGIGKATMAAGAATTAMGVAALHSYGDFQSSLNKAAVIAGGTAKDIDGLSDVANHMGAVLPLNANQCAEAMVNMARNGASIDDIKREFPAIAEASTAAGEDINTTAGVVQEAMNIWKGSLQSPQQAAAILVQTANASNASIGDMQQAMATMGPIANMAGMDMQTTATAIGLLTNHGFSAAQASQDLSHAITMMVAPSRGAEKTMKSLGLSFTDAQGHMKPFPQILQEIAAKTDGMGDAQKTAALKTMFGAAGMKAIEPLLESVKDKTGNVTTSWDAFSGAMDKAAGNTDKATKTLENQANEMQQNVGSKIEQVGGNWDSLSKKALAAKGGVTSSILDMINHTLEWATTSHSKTAEVARGFVGLAPEIGVAVTAVGGFITKFGAITSAVGTGVRALGNFGKTTTAVIRIMRGVKDGKKALDELAKSSTVAKVAQMGLQAATKLADLAQKIFNADLLFNPWTWVIAGIVAVVAALTIFFTKTKKGREIWKNFTSFLKNVWNQIKILAHTIWTNISNFLKVTWNGIKAVAIPIFNAIKTVITTAWNAIKIVTTTVWNGIKTVLLTIWNLIKPQAMVVFNAIKTVITTVWNNIRTVTMTVWNAIKTVLITYWNNLKTVAMTVWNGIKSVISNVWNVIKSITQLVWNVIKGLLTGNWNGIKSSANNVFNSIKSLISSVWHAVSSITSSVWNAIKSVLSSIWNGIKSVGNSYFHALQSTISSIWHAIASVTSSVWNGIKGTLSGIWHSISSSASSIWNGIKSNITSAVSNMASNVSSKAHSMMDRFVSAVRSGGEKAVSKARSIAHHIVSGIKDGLGDLYDVASNAMQGFVNGVIDMGNEAIHAAEHIASNIVSTIKSALDIHSPSKVMRDEVGVWIPAGVAVGMQKNMDTVASAANDVANAATVTIPAVKTNKFTDSLKAVKKASRDVLSSDLNSNYSLNINKQPAHINLTLGGHDYETTVSDISKQQGTSARLRQSYRL